MIDPPFCSPKDQVIPPKIPRPPPPAINNDRSLSQTFIELLANDSKDTGI